MLSADCYSKEINERMVCPRINIFYRLSTVKEKGDFLVFGKRLRPSGAGYGFCQNSMNFRQQIAVFHTLRKRLPVVTLQTGALD
jgi:hypothetical protein